MKNPKISIITVCFNSEKTIEDTLKSVISQDYENKEYIIIDGGSTDGTLTIIDRYRKGIDILVSEKDHGISDAFNKGIAHATGDVIGIINSDDILLPGTLSRLASECDGTDVYRMNVVIWNSETGRKFREIPSMRFPLFPLSIHVAHQGTFVTNECYKKNGSFNEDLHYVMDRDLLMRFFRQGATFKYVDHDSSLYRMGGVTSNDLKKKKAEYIYLVKAHGGTSLQAHAYYCYLCVRNVVKHILDYFGTDLKRRLRYQSFGKSVLIGLLLLSSLLTHANNDATCALEIEHGTQTGTVYVRNPQEMRSQTNNPSVKEIILSKGIWPAEALQSALSQRSISTSLVICGETNNSGEKLTTISGLSQESSAKSLKDGLFSISNKGEKFPIVYHNGERMKLKGTPLFKLKGSLKLNGDKKNGNITSIICSDWSGTDSNNRLVNAGNQIKAGSIISIALSFFNLRLQVTGQVGNNLTVRSESKVNIDYFNTLCNTKRPCHVKIYNTSGEPGKGEYIFDEGKIECRPVERNGKHVFQLLGPSSLLVLQEKSNLTFRNLLFCENGIQDFTIGTSIHKQSEDQCPGAIALHGCHDIVFEHCTMQRLAGYAICTNQGRGGARCSRIKISHCELSDLYGGGIHLNDTDESEISDNLIDNYGQMMMSSCGILLRYGCKNLISGNIIREGFYTGISIGWNWDWQYTLQGKIPSGENTIEGNTIHHCMKGNVMEDGGGIYTLGGTEGSIIEGNIVYDLHECRGANAAAIYLDQATTEVTVRDNTCWNNRVNLHINYGYHNQVAGNVFAYPLEKNIWFDNSKNFSQKEESEKHLPLNKKTVIKSGTAFYSTGNTYIQEGGTLIHLGALNATTDGSPCYVLKKDKIDDCGVMMHYVEYPNERGKLIQIDKLNYGKSGKDRLPSQVRIQSSKCSKAQCADQFFDTKKNSTGKSVKVYKHLSYPVLFLSSPFQKSGSQMG